MIYQKPRAELLRSFNEIRGTCPNVRASVGECARDAISQGQRQQANHRRSPPDVGSRRLLHVQVLAYRVRSSFTDSCRR